MAGITAGLRFRSHSAGVAAIVADGMGAAGIIVENQRRRAPAVTKL
jgi:hypothetical protein